MTDFDATAILTAFFAPLVLWLLWRIQALAVDHGLRRGMYRLLRYQRRTYNVVSWFGVLLHELSHASFLLLGGHGIRNFRVGVDSGHVTPTQVRRGPVGLLTFLAAAMAPMFVAPLAIFLTAWLLLDRGLLVPARSGLGWDAAWPVLQATATDVPVALAQVLIGLDLASASGAAVFLLAVLAMPSARPSHVPARRGQPAEGDIAVVRAKVRRHPATVLAFVALLVASYALVAVWPVGYWAFWQTAWAVSLTAILLSLLGAIGWAAVAWAGRTVWWLAWMPLAAALAIQIGGRQLDAPLWSVNLASMALFAMLALALWSLAPRRY